jgi:hypothetical protein
MKATCLPFHLVRAASPTGLARHRQELRHRGSQSGAVALSVSSPEQCPVEPLVIRAYPQRLPDHPLRFSASIFLNALLGTLESSLNHH